MFTPNYPYKKVYHKGLREVFLVPTFDLLYGGSNFKFYTPYGDGYLFLTMEVTSNRSVKFSIGSFNSKGDYEPKAYIENNYVSFEHLCAFASVLLKGNYSDYNYDVMEYMFSAWERSLRSYNKLFRFVSQPAMFWFKHRGVGYEYKL